jgi:hypothetical protein
MEKLAEEVTTEFSTVCVKLKELKPKIELIRSHFQRNIRGSVTLSACRSFREFCKNRLHRSEQAVYRLLSSDSKNSQKKTRVPKVPTAHQKPTFAYKDFERLRSACIAAARYFHAEDRGEKMVAAKAKAEFLAITNAESIRPLISRAVPAMRKRLGVNEASFGLLPKQDPLSSAATEHSGRPMGGPPGAAQTGAAPGQV